MKRTPLISRSSRASRAGTPQQPGSGETGSAPAQASTATARPTSPTSPTAPAPGAARPRSRWGASQASARALAQRGRLQAWAPWVVAAGFALLALTLASSQRPRLITQDDIDAAVRASLEKDPLPSPYARAAAAVAPSLVRVQGLMDENDDGEENAQRRALDRSLGTGVVIVGSVK